MKNFKLLLLVAIFGISMNALHSEAMEVGILGGLSIYGPSVQQGSFTTTTSKPGTSFVAGAYLIHPLGMMSSIEIDALYVKRSVEVITTGGTDDTYASKVVQIPVIFRVNLIPSILSVGAGPYYEIGLSSGVDDTFGGTTANYSYTALNMKHMDYGLVGSARFQLPLFPFVRMLVDARYVYGLSEQYLDTSLGESLKNRYIQVFAGLGLSM